MCVSMRWNDASQVKVVSRWMTEAKDKNQGRRWKVKKKK